MFQRRKDKGSYVNIQFGFANIQIWMANTSVCSANMRFIAAGDQRATNWTNAKGWWWQKDKFKPTKSCRNWWWRWCICICICICIQILQMQIQTLDLEFICCISHIIVVNPTYVCMYLAFMRHATIVLHLLPGSDLQYNFKILPEHQLQNLKQTEQ